MRRHGKRSLLSALVLAVAASGAGATHLLAEEAPAAIRCAMAQQVLDWNRGDVRAFMRSYHDSPETTFLGKQIEHGYRQILSRYKKKYPDREAMGQLAFTALDVRMLGSSHAVVTGRFHLTRSKASGGDAGGIFSLVWEKEPEGWRIILDHTSSD